VISSSKRANPFHRVCFFDFYDISNRYELVSLGKESGNKIVNLGWNEYKNIEKDLHIPS